MLAFLPFGVSILAAPFTGSPAIGASVVALGFAAMLVIWVRVVPLEKG
jgi:hypothetical protein